MLTVYFNDKVIDEIFSIIIDENSVTIGLYYVQQIWWTEGILKLDYGAEDISFNVVITNTVLLDNGGSEVTFGIE
jgi:hypothetical protein